MSKPYDAKADLWSVATIAYQALTGRAPFPATSPGHLKQIYERTSQLTATYVHYFKHCLINIDLLM